MISIPMLDLKVEYDYMKKDIDAAISKCLEHQKWILGPEVKALEDAISRYLGVGHCIGASSGTEALVLSLRALAIKRTGKEYFEKSDEIITSPFTFTATGDAILRSGATPVFVDIDPVTFNLDVTKVAEYLKTSTKAVGIVPVHLYGQSCDMDSIMEIAGQADLFVVEDVAQAFGAAWKGRKLGSIGTTGCFSFFPSKNLGGFGDGGMISTNDDEISDLAHMLLKHGGKDKYNVDHIGYNARLDTIQASVVLAKFNYIDEFNKMRRRIAMTYDEGLKELECITTPAIRNPYDVFHVYHQYTLRVEDRNKFQMYLKDRGIATMVYYPYPLHQMKVFRSRNGLKSKKLSQAEAASTSVCSLPIEPLQSEETTRYIMDCVKEYLVNR